MRKLAGLCREGLMRHLMPCSRVAIAQGAHDCSGDPSGEDHESFVREAAAVGLRRSETATEGSAEMAAR
jgi:hypothetical protein